MCSGRRKAKNASAATRCYYRKHHTTRVPEGRVAPQSRINSQLPVTLLSAGGIDNRRRSTDRVETFRRRPDSTWSDGIKHQEVHYKLEWPQWRPMRKLETCQRIWCDWKTSGPPMHGHRCGVPKPEHSFSTKVNGVPHYCDSEYVENY